MDVSPTTRAPCPDTHPRLLYRKDGRRWRGRLPIPTHAHPLVRRLYAELNKQQTTMKEVEDRAGLRLGAIGEWGRRHTPRVADLDAALNVIGYRVQVVSGESR